LIDICGFGINKIIKGGKIFKKNLNLIIILFGVLIFKNAYAVNNCSIFVKNFNNQIDKIFKSIESLENCIKPASKYRLNSCIKRKQEGSKGFNCLPELSKALNYNKKKVCDVRFNEIKRSLQNLASLDEDYTNCDKLENK